MKLARIINCTRPTKNPLLIRYCSSFFCRLRGLMFQPSLAPYEGLLMVQPRSDRLDAAIHMLFMAFDITVVWMDDNQRVVDVQLARRWRLAYAPAKAARYVLEIHADRFEDFKPGDQLAIELC